MFFYEICKIIKTPFLQNTSEDLLLRFEDLLKIQNNMKKISIKNVFLDAININIYRERERERERERKKKRARGK